MPNYHTQYSKYTFTMPDSTSIEECMRNLGTDERTTSLPYSDKLEDRFKNLTTCDSDNNRLRQQSRTTLESAVYATPTKRQKQNVVFSRTDSNRENFFSTPANNNNIFATPTGTVVKKSSNTPACCPAANSRNDDASSKKERSADTPLRVIHMNDTFCACGNNIVSSEHCCECKFCGHCKLVEYCSLCDEFDCQHALCECEICHVCDEVRFCGLCESYKCRHVACKCCFCDVCQELDLCGICDSMNCEHCSCRCDKCEECFTTMDNCTCRKCDICNVHPAIVCRNSKFCKTCSICENIVLCGKCEADDCQHITCECVSCKKCTKIAYCGLCKSPDCMHMDCTCVRCLSCNELLDNCECGIIGEMCLDDCSVEGDADSSDDDDSLYTDDTIKLSSSESSSRCRSVSRGRPSDSYDHFGDDRFSADRIEQKGVSECRRACDSDIDMDEL